jgi:hypothetical protein
MHHTGGPNSHIDYLSIAYLVRSQKRLHWLYREALDKQQFFFNLHLCNLKHIWNPLHKHNNAVEMAVRLITCATTEDDADLTWSGLCCLPRSVVNTSSSTVNSWLYLSSSSIITPFVQPNPIWFTYSPPVPCPPGNVASYLKNRDVTCLSHRTV